MVPCRAALSVSSGHSQVTFSCKPVRDSHRPSLLLLVVGFEIASAPMPAQNPDKYSLQNINMDVTVTPDFKSESSQQLMTAELAGDDSQGSSTPPFPRDNVLFRHSNRNQVSKAEWITVIILCYVNLINYMDRFTTAGVLTKIQKHFSISDAEAGLLQTVFVLSYMVFAPLFGYLGDRYNRKILLALGVGLWSLTTFLGSFMKGSFHGFILFRALVGIGEASYSTIAPTIISDLFINDLRSKMLALFYFAIPVGSGMGYIVGSQMLHWTGQWENALRVTPVLGIIAVLLILFAMINPRRGEHEMTLEIESTSWREDIVQLCYNKSFVLSTAGFTCVAFVTGALAWWGPTFLHLGINLQPGRENESLNSVSLKFGVITMLSGILGVPAGSALAQYLRPRYPRIDPLICAGGLLLSTPFFFASLLLANINSELCFTCIFFGELFLNLNWSIVADILLYVVISTRRSTAEAFQILISHAFGDAGSPYLIGVIADTIKNVLPSIPAVLAVSLLDLNGNSDLLKLQDSNLKQFKSLQYSLFITTLVVVLGAFFFFMCSLSIIKDKSRASIPIDGSPQPRNIFADDAQSIDQTESLVP